jgi:hypothetical protein
MHTSVEKHSLRSAESCGTLAHASRFSFSGSAIRFGNLWFAISGSAIDRVPHACAVFLLGATPRGSFRQALERTLLYNRLQSPHGFSHPKLFPKLFQGLLLNMPRRPSAATAATPHPLISNQRLQQLYVTLLRARLLRQRNPLKGSTTSLVAREAIVTGTVTHLEDGDAVMSVSGDRLAALARGYGLHRVLAGGSLPGILVSAPTVDARFSIATGYALARQGAEHVVLAFSGSGLRSLDAIRAPLAYAAQHKLGIVFVIESAADAELSSARNTEPLGLYGIPVDGNDVVAIYRVAQEAIHRARRGVGPTLIDCKPWPLDGAADPVLRLEQALERRGIPASKLKQRTLAAFKKELGAASRKRR